ncbi:periplasmic binding protein-like I [Globomyces pollinis-pini]|nr:periplasmic binding protein-like I [Globomyces pollinis-pini]
MRLILFIILLPFICTLSVNGTKKVRIGMTLAFSLEQDSFYATAINAIYLHVQQLNEQSKLFDDDTKIELFHLENDIQRPQILKAGVEFIKSDVLAIIGAGWSSLTDLLLLVTRNSQLPVCDGASTSPMLSNKVKYPNFFRTVPQDANQAEAIVGFIKSNGWKKIGIIYSNEPYGLGLTTHTEKLSALNGIQVLSKISYQPYAEKQSYVTLMQRMKETGVRIILIYCLQQSSFQSFLELAK